MNNIETFEDLEIALTGKSIKETFSFWGTKLLSAVKKSAQTKTEFDVFCRLSARSLERLSRGETVDFDLHGLRLRSAKSFMISVLDLAHRFNSAEVGRVVATKVEFLVGKGLHSKGGTAVLATHLPAMLSSLNIKSVLDHVRNSGVLVVTLSSLGLVSWHSLRRDFFSLRSYENIYDESDEKLNDESEDESSHESNGNSGDESGHESNDISGDESGHESNDELGDATIKESVFCPEQSPPLILSSKVENNLDQVKQFLKNKKLKKKNHQRNCCINMDRTTVLKQMMKASSPELGPQLQHQRREKLFRTNIQFQEERDILRMRMDIGSIKQISLVEDEE